jgi:hypothetical protein
MADETRAEQVDHARAAEYLGSPPDLQEPAERELVELLAHHRFAALADHPLNTRPVVDHETGFGVTQQAARALVAKLDECEPHITDAFLHRELRCGPYEGPNYGEELKALRRLLTDAPSSEKLEG